MCPKHVEAWNKLIIKQNFCASSWLITEINSLWCHHTYRCDDTRGCVIQFWPPDDEHMCSKHVEAWTKLIVKQNFFCVKLVNYWDKYTEMHRQQNVKIDALISQIYFGIKLYMFQTVPLSNIRSLALYTQQWYMSYRFADSLRAGSGCNILIPLASCQQTCMTYTIAVCTVLNSWWWTEDLSEICRVLFQNKFEKLVHLVDFIIRICHDARSPERQKRLKICHLQYDVSKFCYGCCEYVYVHKIFTLIKLGKISIASQLVTTDAVHRVENYFSYTFSSRLRTRWYILRRVVLWRWKCINLSIRCTDF